MSIHVIGSTKNKFPIMDEGRRKFFIDEPHDGDNIDYLNQWYCELTGLYYLWKHDKSIYVGLEHYRRYFLSEKNKGSRMTIFEAEEILKDVDLIVTDFRFDFGASLEKWFQSSGKMPSMEKFISVLSESDQNGFRDFLRDKTLIQCNMFIGKKSIVDEWCEFLFDALDKHRKIETLGNRNKRISGYIGEYLFGYWIKSRGISHKIVLKRQI